MGGTTFEQVGRGATADEAFANAREDAHYEYGHRPYTGSIAEKYEFVQVVAELMDLAEARALADKLITESDPRINSKWGPAGMIPLTTVAPATFWRNSPDGKRTPLNGGERQWLFFGWASC